MQAITEQVKDLSETATKVVMDALKGVGGPQGKSGADPAKAAELRNGPATTGRQSTPMTSAGRIRTS